VAPVIGRHWIGTTWLDLGYIRAYRVLQAYSFLEGTGWLVWISEFHLALVKMGLRTVALVICMAGASFSLEVLGDIHGFTDDTLESGMGSISFYQCIYWVFTTISTVGYGDFSPSTVPARAFTIVCIIGGVIFFSIETGTLVEVFTLLKMGKGRYAPTREAQNAGCGHVVVLGGGVKFYSGILDDFLREIIHTDHRKAPDVVIMSVVPPDETMLGKLKESWASGKVTYLKGSPLEQEDRDRACLDQAQMVFVLPDSESNEPDWEDEQNIIYAVAVLRAQPEAKLRILLLRPENREQALRVGIRRHFCFSLNELKVGLMSQSCRNPGYSTLLLGLIESAEPSLDNPCQGLTEDELCLDQAGWNAQYCWGESYEMRGCELHRKYAGYTFHQLAQHLLKTEGVIAFALQINGRLTIAPMEHVIKAQGEILFMLAMDDDQLQNIKAHEVHDETTWQKVFRSNRNRVFPRERERNLAQLDKDQQFKVEDRFYEDADVNLNISAGAAAPMHNDANPLVLAQFQAVANAAAAASASANESPRYTRNTSRRPSQLIDENGEPRAPRPPRSRSPFWSDADSPFNSPLSPEEVDDDDDDENWEKKFRKESKKLAVKLMAGGGHVVLLGSTTGLWQQIIAFLRPLKANYLARHFKIIVVVPEECPRHVAKLKIFKDVAFLDNHPLRSNTLPKLMIETASKVIVLGGRPLTDDPVMVDSKTIIIANMLEEYLEMAGVKYLSEDCFLCYEFFKDTNISLLPSVEAECFNHELALPPHCAEPKYSPRYTSGSLLFPHKFGSLLAVAFYTPGVMELFEAMCIPSRRDQMSMPWRIKVPEFYHGKEYGDLVTDLISGELATKRATGTKFNQSVNRENDTGGASTEEGGDIANEDSKGAAPEFFIGSNKALPIGLYRSPGKNGSLLGYVFTGPPLKTPLCDGDFVFCFAPADFGHAMIDFLA